MNSIKRYCRQLAVAGLLACLAASHASAADTTVAAYLKLEKRGQAHLLGSLLQSLADDLQQKDMDKTAECLASLYTATAQSEARVVRSRGIMDFLQSVEIAREKDPEKTTVEEIIARQLVQFCGYGQKK